MLRRGVRKSLRARLEKGGLLRLVVCVCVSVGDVESAACCCWLRLPPRLPAFGTGFGCAGPARLNCCGLLFCIQPRICSTSSPCSWATRTTSGLPTRNFQLQCSASCWRAIFWDSLKRVPLADTVREGGGADGAALLDDELKEAELKGAAPAATPATPPPAICSMLAMRKWDGMKKAERFDDEGREADG